MLALPQLRGRVCVFKQTLLFPVSCQIIAFGIQGFSASRRTKLKLELIEQNIVFLGDARAAHGPSFHGCGRREARHDLGVIPTAPCCGLAPCLAGQPLGTSAWGCWLQRESLGPGTAKELCGGWASACSLAVAQVASVAPCHCAPLG